MKRVEQVRIYPSRTQIQRLNVALETTRQLYNLLLGQRADAWKTRRLSISTKLQSAQLTELRSCELRFKAVNRDSENAVLHRLHLAYEAFFHRVRNGESAGFPRFKPPSRWHHLNFPQGRSALKFYFGQSRLYVPRIGLLRVRRGRPVPPFGRAWLTRRASGWYASFECTREVVPLAKTGKQVGIDRGVGIFLASSDGELLANPHFFERAGPRLTSKQRLIDHRSVRDALGKIVNRDGKNRQKAILQYRRAWERIRYRRRDFAHKISRWLVNSYDLIAIEDLNVRKLMQTVANVRAKLYRSLLDSSFGLLRHMIEAKAEEAGRTVVAVDPRYPSQTCFNCGHVAAASRKGARFCCAACGYTSHADVNAARVILRRAELQLVAKPRQTAVAIRAVRYPPG